MELDAETIFATWCVPAEAVPAETGRCVVIVRAALRPEILPKAEARGEGKEEVQEAR